MNGYLDFAIKTAHHAGEIMLEHFKVGIDKEIKSDNTPVTVADKKINDLVIDAVNLKYPDHSIMGEEASELKDDSEFTWVCDPIDGTTPYTFGIPTNVFSLALVQDGSPVVSVVFDPYTKRMYTAIKDQGAYLNGIRLRVNDKTEIAANRLGLSGPPTKLIDTTRFYTALAKRDVRHLYLVCTIYEGMLVASGQIMGNVFSGNTAHDAATMKLIVEEAGGKVTDLLGNEQRYDQPINGVIVSNGKVHQELVELVAGCLSS